MGMDGKKRRAFFKMSADRRMKINTRHFIGRRPGQFGHAGNAAVINGRDLSRFIRFNDVGIFGAWYVLHTALGITDCLELRPGFAAI